MRRTVWFHMLSHDVITMRDEWESPWYAPDLAFHRLGLVVGHGSGETT